MACFHWQECGEILFGLSYLPTAQRLSFSLVKVTGIKAEKSVEEPISESWQSFCVGDN